MLFPIKPVIMVFMTKSIVSFLQKWEVNGARNFPCSRDLVLYRKFFEKSFFDMKILNPYITMLPITSAFVNGRRLFMGFCCPWKKFFLVNFEKKDFVEFWLFD